MTARIRAHINPDVLVWARETAGYSIDEAAAKIGISESLLSRWEEGSDLPTVKQLRNIGRVYKRPTALFYRSVVPENPPIITDFRTLPNSLTCPAAPLLFEIRRAYERREIAIRLMEELGEPIPKFDLAASMDMPSGELARKLRRALGITLEEQFAWRDHYSALRAWTAAIERLGILVIHINNVPLEQARGFSISERPLPIIAINGKDSVRGRIFSLLHELTHIVLQNGGVCDFLEFGSNDTNSVEVFCNQVAGEVLVPGKVLIEQDIVQQNEQNLRWGDWQLKRLSNRFMVSREVILRRLLALNRTTLSFYQKKREEYLEELEELRHNGSVEVRIPYYQRVLKTNGVAYTNLVLTAYRNDAITSRDLSNFLGGVNLKHIKKLETELAKDVMRGTRW